MFISEYDGRVRGMLITAIQVRRLENTGTKLKGIASITLDNMIVIHDIKILKNNDVMFLAMPSKEVKARSFKDIVHPINSATRQVIERLIFTAYVDADDHKYSQLNSVLAEEYANIDFYDLSYEHFVMKDFTEGDMIPTKENDPKKISNQDDLMKGLES